MLPVEPCMDGGDSLKKRTRLPVIVGVAGGTGSGKTTVVMEIMNQLGSNDVVMIAHDAYYKDRSLLPMEVRATLNYDHPDALDTSLLVEHLRQLQAGIAIDMPVYDFSSHTRRPDHVHIEPHKVIVVEGILIFADEELRKLFDIKVYVDTDADIRFIRRMERDILERARTRESVVRQYLDTVRPMHNQFVEPSKVFADVIVLKGDEI